MSNETETQEDQELKEMEQQLMEAEANKTQAAVVVEEPPTPSPESPPSPAPEPVPAPAPVTPSSTEKPKDDPLKWAEGKGLKSPEDMARALQQKEIEFHKRNQAGHPGYRDFTPDPAVIPPPPPPPPNWQPQPQGYGYPPPPNYGYQQPPVDPRQIASEYGMLPEDFDKVARLSADMTRAALNRERQRWEREIGDIRRTTERSDELMALMQDPAFRDNGVQREIHAVLDSDPAIFQRERKPHTYAFERALSNLARKQLQQGITRDIETPNKPPVTAGGGNGSAHTEPFVVTEAVFNTWTVKQQEEYLLSNGTKIPKK